MRYTFTDFYKNEVVLAFEDEPFSRHPKHVWVISRFKNRWLLTQHGSRGLEFPGGKVELGETASAAAIRELLEETGGIAKELTYVAQYYVSGKSGDVIKNVYFAEIDRLEEQETYFETHGPVLLDELPRNIKNDGTYSFMMKDEVLARCVEFIEESYEL